MGPRQSTPSRSCRSLLSSWRTWKESRGSTGPLRRSDAHQRRVTVPGLTRQVAEQICKARNAAGCGHRHACARAWKGVPAPSPVTAGGETACGRGGFHLQLHAVTVSTSVPLLAVEPPNPIPDLGEPIAGHTLLGAKPRLPLSLRWGLWEPPRTPAQRASSTEPAPLPCVIIQNFSRNHLKSPRGHHLTPRTAPQTRSVTGAASSVYMAPPQTPLPQRERGLLPAPSVPEPSTCSYPRVHSWAVFLLRDDHVRGGGEGRLPVSCGLSCKREVEALRLLLKLVLSILPSFYGELTRRGNAGWCRREACGNGGGWHHANTVTYRRSFWGAQHR